MYIHKEYTCTSILYVRCRKYEMTVCKEILLQTLQTRSTLYTVVYSERFLGKSTRQSIGRIKVGKLRCFKFKIMRRCGRATATTRKPRQTVSLSHVADYETETSLLRMWHRYTKCVYLRYSANIKRGLDVFFRARRTLKSTFIYLYIFTLYSGNVVI